MKTNDILKELRLRKGMTQQEFADALDINLSSYQKYERANNSIKPSIDSLIKIADFYGVSVDYLIGRTAPIDPIAALPAAETERELLSGYFDLPPQQRADFCETLLKIVERRKGRSRIAETTTAGALHDRLAAQSDADAEESAG